jgi:hypothetical protein
VGCTLNSNRKKCFLFLLKWSLFTSKVNKAAVLVVKALATCQEFPHARRPIPQLDKERGELEGKGREIKASLH